MAVPAPLTLRGPARVDADHIEEELDVLRPALGDDREPDSRTLAVIALVNADEAVGLEDAGEVRANLVVCCRPKTSRNADLGSARQQLPALDEGAQNLAVEPDPMDRGRLGLRAGNVPMDLGEDRIEVI